MSTIKRHSKLSTSLTKSKRNKLKILDLAVLSGIQSISNGSLKVYCFYSKGGENGLLLQ